MIRKIQDLETEFHNVKLERNQFESELKAHLIEMDQQKAKMEDKLSKLKIALEN